MLQNKPHLSFLWKKTTSTAEWSYYTYVIEWLL